MDLVQCCARFVISCKTHNWLMEVETTFVTIHTHYCSVEHEHQVRLPYSAPWAMSRLEIFMYASGSLAFQLIIGSCIQLVFDSYCKQGI